MAYDDHHKNIVIHHAHITLVSSISSVVAKFCRCNLNARLTASDDARIIAHTFVRLQRTHQAMTLVFR